MRREAARELYGAARCVAWRGRLILPLALHAGTRRVRLLASPSPRPGEATGVSPEIKALQQTRRLLANARERTRVHTISAAFEALRKQVPAGPRCRGTG